jgi:hypothetical protein
LLAKAFASLSQRLQIGWQGASILNAHFQVAQAFGCAESEQRHLSSHIQTYHSAGRSGRNPLRCRRNAYKA